MLFEKSITTICGVCPDGCTVDALVRDAKLERILPVKGHPFGVPCTRGAASKGVVYSEDRLKHPMMRVGDKGEGEFREISWDEALDTVARELKKARERYGAGSVSIYSGRGGYFEDGLHSVFGVKSNGEVASNLLYPFGSPNTGSCSSICYISNGMIAPMTTFGIPLSEVRADFRKARLIVIWGANPAVSSVPLVTRRIVAAKKRGAKVITIDHRKNQMAQLSDLWIPIRPGTDGALALGLMNEIFKEELFDEVFVSDWTVGFNELQDYAKSFTPDIVEKITWVPAETIRKISRLIGETKPSTVVAETGLEYSNCAVQTIRAILTLWAVTGNFDVPGGLTVRMPLRLKTNQTSIKCPVIPEPIGAKKYPIFYKYSGCMQFTELPKAVLRGEPYPVKALIVHGASILTSYPNPELWKKVFRALDFMVVIDRFPTSDSKYADIVLPATTFYEIESYKQHGNHIQRRRKIIEPLWESRSDYSIVYALAERLGYAHLYPPEDKLVEFALKDTGISISALDENPTGIGVKGGTPMVYRKYEAGLLRKDGRSGFETPSGKFEIASSVLKECGYDPLPSYTEPKESPLSSPLLTKNYPLIFSSGARLASAFRSQYLNIPSLLKLQPKPQVIIHPRDASSRDISDGDEVYVTSPRGKAKFWARVSDRILKGVVEVNSCGGGLVQAEAWRQTNANILTDPENCDPISGFPVFKALLCDVEKITFEGRIDS